MSLFNLNRATLIGNVTRDPELRYTAKGTALLRFSIATSRSMQAEDGSYKDLPTFHNIVTWSKLAERMGKVLSKGKTVYVEGRIDNRSYEKDGVTKYISEVVADNVIAFDRTGASGGAAIGAGSKKNKQDDATGYEEPAGIPNEAEDVDPDDIPF